ncbi:uncharacterized protein [Euphorbia lathyris]|uniref:uncharacterized protein n=1 Tax=Euphorbia lathyris TaxID=212925 RepID=UPI0033136519
MQRQSLGSPVSKLHSHGCGGANDDNLISDDPKRKDLPSPSLSHFDDVDADDEYCKAMKPPHRRFSSSPSSSFSITSSPPKPEKLVHFIPLLTLLCFLVLYFVSHAPSPSDLAQFNGLKRSSKHIDSSEIRDVDTLTDLRRGDVLAIRNLRNLQEVEIRTRNRKSRPHRKISADF